ncbi:MULTISPECIES: ABC transporter permease [Glutamicibacter]|uniref:ABC transporter permease n=1 Tax=Glutamicibacter halophytocola TaxID=1933880 RepID=A0A5B8IPQ8_9MICC|nr:MULTISPECIES: ABC transporter permease [Glutamicibacter]ALG30073.1 ABC transporter permease [Glutamicibacter halophytocola]MBF6670754.1 ABC transporter permease [Glutamicibacter sp. FBE19]NQD41257.1 ABC transporter permease [Glutamicibacter halophytocola]QDY66348.1 ABC transporter permease [Glutamicibacter halophytocola]UUX58448.1 ABC transporter permease [Glutamicibacter halophytocola]
MSAEKRTLIWQIVAIAAAFAVLMVWLLTADLTETERQTLDPATIWGYTLEHLKLTVISTVIVLIIAIPLGIVLTRPGLRRAAPVVRAIANFGQAAPAIGVVVLLAFWLGFGAKTAIVSLVIYAILPVLSNTIVGLQQVDQRIVEAGRGIGMSLMAVLFKVELPLAVPVMLSGIRTALVLLVGTATLATFINGGGLGILITTGVNLNLNVVLITGSLLVALLALTIDWLGRVVEQVARPKGLS